MLRLLEEKAVLLNSQYEHHREVIERIICSLLQQVESLVLPLSDLEDAKDYIRDKGKVRCNAKKKAFLFSEKRLLKIM